MSREKNRKHAKKKHVSQEDIDFANALKDILQEFIHWDDDIDDEYDLEEKE